MRWLALACALLIAAALPRALPAAASSLPAAGQPITVPFDHLTTGFELEGVHRDLPCESCHLNAVFYGTPRDCGSCHMAGAQFNATPKNPLHIPSSNNCAACHNTISFRPSFHFDHSQVLGSCVSCHNGTIAQGEGPTHPQTSQNCAACHSVMSWNPTTRVDHTQIPLAVAGYCIVCHNGTTASGKPANHIVTSLECGDCHTTTTWLGSNFNHTGITGGCFSCHNGVKAVGKATSHMPTSNLCESCHTTGIGTPTPSWVPSLFNHTQMSVTTCATCHGGQTKISTGIVPGQPANHVPPIPALVDCGVCHGNNPAKETWDVLAVTIPQLHAGLSVNNCLECHAGQTYAGVPAPYSPMSESGISPNKKTALTPPHIPTLSGADCSACHAAAYQTGGFGPATAMSAAKHAYVTTTCTTCHETGSSFYTGGGTALQLRPADHLNSADPRMKGDNCSECHTTTDWTSNTMPAGHMPNPGNQACNTCHIAAPANYTTLAADPVLHTGITGNCGQCHGNTASALTWFNNFTPRDAILTPAHIPYLAGTDCSSCHVPSSYAVGGFGPMNMTQAKHAFVPTSCDTCHEAGLTFTMGAASPGLQGRPADHTSGNQVAPNDCSLCHTTANWISTVLPTGHMPNPANQACTVCHTAAPTDYTTGTLAAYPVLHTGITGNCGQCHGSTTGALTWYNNFTPRDAVLAPAHIPFLPGTDCSSCHAPSTYLAGAFGPMNMTQAKHTFVPTSCDTCHEAGLTFTMGAASPGLQGRPADHTTGNMVAPNDCSLCHTTANWNSTVLPAGHMPNPANQSCTVCHTTAPNDYTTATLAANSVLHNGITSGCGTCHGGTAPLTWYNNFTPKDGVLTPAHIPYLAGTDCGSCHSSATYAAGTFGPMNMTQAKHSFVSATCITCHEAGANFFMGLANPGLQGRPADHTTGQMVAPNDCSLCHTTANWNSTALPAGHMPNPAGNQCTVCHTSAPSNYAPLAIISVLHTGISNGCAQCHGGATQLTFYNNNDNPKAAVLTPAHIPAFTGTDCSNCHAANYVAGGFGPMNMTQATHSGLSGSCDSCHEAGLSFYMGAANPGLQGRPADHNSGQMVAPNDCSICHTTANWNSSVLPTGHMPNPANQNCTVCHTTAPSDYTPATLAANSVLHTGISSGCGQCHGGTTPLTWYNNFTPKDGVLTPAHIPYLSGTDCGSCHASATYAAGTFGPMNMTQAKHAFVATSCDTCHEAGLSYYMGAASPALQGRPADHTSGNMVAPNDCSLCHTTANWNSTVLPTGHMPNPANQACTVCHTTAPADYTTATLAANSVLHTGISSGCSQCHGGTTPLTWYNNFTPKDGVLTPSHIPYLSGTDCGSCHASATYAAGTFGPMNMTQAKHAFVVTTCDTCHEAGLSFYMGAASPALQGRPADHTSGNMVAPNDCSLCHTTANWNSTVLPAGHMPNPANQACTVCHTTAPADYSTTTLAANATLHTGITSGCLTCHGGPAGALTFYNNFTPKAAVLSPVHIPTSTTPCEDCHSTTVFTSFSGTTMSSAKHTSMFTVIAKSCDPCHNRVTPALSFYGVTNLQTRPTDHNSGSKATNDCSGCHNTNSWDGGAQARAARSSTAAASSTRPASTAVAAPGTGATGASVTAGTTATATAAARILSAAPAASMAPRAFSHAGVTAACVSCHDGVQAAGKGIGHIASNDSCGNCHTTIAWLPARFDHAGVLAACATCHNGVTAAGRPVTHLSTTLGCGSCHSTLSWRPAHYAHSDVVGTCQTCHNTATGLGKPASHPATTLDCSSCHSTQAWLPVLGAPQQKPALSPPAMRRGGGAQR
jgi:hypothetical protein